ncbi:ABC transporter ATP-binding protein [Streptomyces inusitatus]|uniref:ABC transporter ATP-binding protein n=1 Tax=Streptomyces inusitatus TaxID=68221 RepID=A0A918V2Q2_9ACTN|nr:ABC transporter ATP-binding protein [Streptomyces inusitatus]GGZ61416.1 ABC transporter ATP-binding protein [Streptomyces inusitatus]
MAQSSPPQATVLRPPGAGRLSLAAVVICSTGAALAALALPAALGAAVDELLASGRIPWTALLLCAALTAAEVVLDALVALLGGTTTAHLTARLRTAVMDRLVRAEPRRGGAIAPGDLTTRLTSNAAEAAAVPVTTANAASVVLLPLGGAVGLLLIDPFSALALLLGTPAFILVLRVLVRRTADASADYQREQALIATRLTETLDGIATVRAARTAAREHARIVEPLTALAAHGRRTWDVHGRAVGASAVLLPLLTVLVLAVAGLRMSSGAISVGDLFAVSRYAVLSVGLGALTGALAAISRGRTAARRLSPLLDLPPVPHRSLALPPGGPGTVELYDVDVVRDGRPVLRAVRLTVPGGTSMAVVGRSGSGKSELAAVAGRLTDPDAGTVTLDGVPLDGVDPVRLREEIAFAFARPALLGTTVEDAIAFGARTPSAAEVRAAARAARADGFVALLPLGYRTPLERAPLSGGEYQRLGLARAFAHAGRLLILDDATSSLDTVTEAHIQRALAARAGAGTRLVVAHRVSSAARADRVVWLENGSVRAVGRHDDLWSDPAYRAVFTAEPGARTEPEAGAAPRGPGTAARAGAAGPGRPDGETP